MRGASLVRIIARARASRTGLGDVRFASTAMRMPAMSPTMTEGGIAGWKKKEGETFAAGDVLLEVETDKATIDVEAQDDGVLGKILVEAGSSKIPVGQVIAVLAEEGDDLSALEIPKDLSPPGASASPESSSSSSATSESASSPKKEDPPPKSDSSTQKASSSSSSTSSTAPSHGHKDIKHSKPIFPSVLRLLTESDLSSEQISKLKGTGKNGMLTKGDVLAALGKVKNPYGSAEKLSTDILGPSGKRLSEKGSGSATSPAKAPEAPLTPAQLRRLIVQGMAHAAAPKRPLIQHSQTSLPRSHDADFDAILAPYASLLPPPQPEVNIPGKDALAAMESKGASRKPDEWAGLF